MSSSFCVAWCGSCLATPVLFLVNPTVLPLLDSSVKPFEKSLVINLVLTANGNKFRAVNLEGLQKHSSRNWDTLLVVVAFWWDFFCLLIVREE